MFIWRHVFFENIVSDASSHHSLPGLSKAIVEISAQVVFKVVKALEIQRDSIELLWQSCGPCLNSFCLVKFHHLNVLDNCVMTRWLPKEDDVIAFVWLLSCIGFPELGCQKCPINAEMYVWRDITRKDTNLRPTELGFSDRRLTF